jgi:hypothetical protein
VDNEVRKRISDPFGCEIEIVEWIRDFEYGEKGKNPEDKISEWGMSRWATGIGSTKIEPRTDSDECEDKPEDIEREFSRTCWCDKITDVPTRPQSDGTEEDNKSFSCPLMLDLPCLWNRGYTDKRRQSKNYDMTGKERPYHPIKGQLPGY